MAIRKTVREFIHQETNGANLLLGAMIFALVFSNSPWHLHYHHFFHTNLTLQFANWRYQTDPLFLINEGLMSIFFLVVGLEIKYELMQGSLNTRAKALLPGIAAVGGMLIPAFIYLAFNYNNVTHLRGWAIPTATDIAFALGVLSLLRHRIPIELKAFLTALAIFDDLAAIIIIALFYTTHFSLQHLSLAFIFMILLTLFNAKNIHHLLIYGVVGLMLWGSFLNAGINPTLAGVVLAALIPLHIALPLKKMLHPIVAFFIMPLFAFANAGVTFFDITLSNLNASITLGIIASLFFGKQIGVFGASWLAVQCRIAELPNKVNWMQLYGVSLLCGIGFTISLFIGALAFDPNNMLLTNSVKIGVLSGSFLSGLAGYFLLARIKPVH
ncbi:MAG TPA: Na+/H+ antiporter NhaA [Gammaproteobacteria bacterium]|nr:Na+/H+ antiporter NhaA [Gammaproteobacteria bacterium]